MAENACGLQDRILFLNDRQIFIHNLFAVHDGTDLKQIKRGLMEIVGIGFDRKLDLHGASHLLLTDLKNLVDRVCQREDIMLKNVDERDDFASSRIISVADHLIHRVESGNDVAECAVFIGIFYGKLEKIECIVHGKGLCQIVEVKCIELRLRLA